MSSQIIVRPDGMLILITCIPQVLEDDLDDRSDFGSQSDRRFADRRRVPQL
jgi:hypothetical protein